MFKSKEQKQLEREAKAEERRLEFGGDWYQLSNGDWLNVALKDGEVTFRWYNRYLTYRWTALNIYPVEVLKKILAG